MVNISICLPSIRVHLLDELYDSIPPSIGKYSFELIISGPFNPSDSLMAKPNFKFIKDFGSPARCTQICTTCAEGRLMTTGSDDGLFMEGALEKAIDYFDSNATKKDQMIMRYREGRGRSGQTQPMEYWNPRWHDASRQPGVLEGWLTAPVGMMDLEYFRELGGWDTIQYEHLNMNCHKLSFLIQQLGGKLHYSPTDIMNCDWTPNEGANQKILEAFFNNDLATFQKEFAKPHTITKIPYDNWRYAPEVWKRRFG